jgi:hypothetical protein
MRVNTDLQSFYEGLCEHVENIDGIIEMAETHLTALEELQEKLPAENEYLATAIKTLEDLLGEM